MNDLSRKLRGKRSLFAFIVFLLFITVTSSRNVNSIGPRQVVTTSCIPGTTVCTTETFFPGGTVILVPTTETTTVTVQVTVNQTVTSTQQASTRTTTMIPDVVVTKVAPPNGQPVLLKTYYIDGCKISEYEETDVETGHTYIVVEIDGCIERANTGGLTTGGVIGVIIGVVVGAIVAMVTLRKRMGGKKSLMRLDSFCGKCGKPANARVCSGCGLAIEACTCAPTQPVEMKGDLSRGGFEAVFCDQCGGKLPSHSQDCKTNLNLSRSNYEGGVLTPKK